MGGHAEDLTGRKFSRLTVIERVYRNRPGTFWLCECDCGNIRIVQASKLKNGMTKSCGCWSKELQEKFAHRWDGHIKSTRCEGKLYRTWSGMRSRCTNTKDPHYRRYGARGISVCEEWDSFDAFKEWSEKNGFAEGLSIDRIDNDKGYSPDNCRWATPVQQATNRSTSRFIVVNGVSKTISEWSRITGVARSTIAYRADKGLQGEEIISKESNRWKRT